MSMALGIPELLENILSHLCITDLIRAAAVSQQWREIVRNSATLQQNLFLRPLSTREWKDFQRLLNFLE